MPAIGIDLGTSNSCVAVSRNGQVNVIANDQGSRLTPSFVSFAEEERLVGEAAKLERSSNVDNTLYQIKRLIGRTYDDPVVQADMKTWGFKVENDNNKPVICVSHRKEQKRFSPEQISAIVLEYIKETAEDYVGAKVTDAIITVPAYFNDSQRSATRDAGVIAGLNVLRMINEPTAAAIAYGLEIKNDAKQTVLIYDLGGGTFDVTIINIEGKLFDVRATGGDTHLGGDDFDNRLVHHFASEFKIKHSCDMSKDKKAMSRLRRECEEVKKRLSVTTKAKISIEALYGGIDFKSEIRRATFEELNRDIFNKTINILEKTLKEAKMEKNEIDEIVIVGGSTRIPRIQELVTKYFNGKALNKKINLDEAIAYGAGALAAKLTNDEHFQSEIYEGERARVKDNHFLGSFSIDNIPSKPRGVEKFSITFSVDESGILTVSARNTSSGNENQIVISNNRARLSAKEVEDMKLEAERMKIEDTEWKARNVAKNALDDFAYAIKNTVDDPKFLNKMSDKDKDRIIKKCTEIISWADTNKDSEVQECNKRRKELEEICRPIFAKLPDGREFLQAL